MQEATVILCSFAVLMYFLFSRLCIVPGREPRGKVSVSHVVGLRRAFRGSFGYKSRFMDGFPEDARVCGTVITFVNYRRRGTAPGDESLQVLLPSVPALFCQTLRRNSLSRIAGDEGRSTCRVAIKINFWRFVFVGEGAGFYYPLFVWE